MSSKFHNASFSLIARVLCGFAAISGAVSQAKANSPIEIRGGVVFSVSAPKLWGPWISAVPSKMPGTGWERLLTIGYGPFLTLRNTSDRAIVIRRTPTVSFSQPAIGFKFTRIGNILPGDITSGPIQVDQMYVSANDRGGKIYRISLYDSLTEGVFGGDIRLAAGQSKIVSPVMPAHQSFDYRNNLTQDMKAIPGWFGHFNAYWVDWLTAGAGNLVPGQNGGFGIIVTRDSDSWDVESLFTGNAAGWRIFDLRPDHSPILSMDSGLEITDRPFKISDHRGMIATADMQVPTVASLAAPGVQALFSMIGPPITTNLITVVTDPAGNSLDDDWEMLHFERIGVDPDDDEDGDGYSNHFEYLSGHSPVDPLDRFSHTVSPNEDGRLTLTWSSSPGLLYAIEHSADLKTWSQVTKEVGAGPPAVSTSCVLDLPEKQAGFFRIRLSGDP